jgi:predicted permease
MRVLLSRVRGLFFRKERDLDDEVRFHLEMMADEYRRRGMSDEEARRAARRQFGGVTQMKEEYRDQQGLPVFEALVQDVRYGIRTLLRTPGFTAAALLTLALGIGANTAIFSVVNAVLLRPLPYPHPDRLANLVWRTSGLDNVGFTGSQYLAYRDSLRSVEALTATVGAGSFNLVSGDRAEFVSGLFISKEYFKVYGVTPMFGGPFLDEHDRTEGPPVLILSHALWQRAFGEDPGVVGRTISLGDKPFTILGVMPEAFIPPTRADVFLPLRPSNSGRGGGSNYTVVGRLLPGVTVEQASAEAAAVYTTVATQQNQEIDHSKRTLAFTDMQALNAAPIRPALLMMLGAVSLLLLIACANTASLLLARASGRGREIAVRAALGARRGRIVRQLITESLLLSTLGAGLGLMLAYWSVPALLALTPPEYGLTEDVSIDSTVLAVTIGLALVTGLVFGLAPALTVTRRNLVDAFRDDSGRTTSNKSSALLRRILVTGEVALCMLLLVGAGLLIQTFARLRAVDPGFDPSNLLTARMSLQGERYAKPDDLNRLYDQGLERIRRIPGVRAAAVASGIPIERALNLNVDVLDGPKKVERAVVDWRYTTPEYFQAMGIPIVAGRGFTAEDRKGAQPVAVVSQDFVKRFFDGANPLGKHIRVFDADGAMEIVGVVADLKERGLKARPIPVMYVPVAQTHERAIRTTHSYFQVTWIVRADNPDARLIRQIEDELRAVDSRQPFTAFRTMDEVKGRAIATERFQMTLLAAFAGIGLLLSAAGIYGLLAYTVAQRTREFGIRVALGASRSRLVTSVIRGGAVLAIIGVALGAAGAAALAKTMQSFVWGVSTLDVSTFVSVAFVLIVVAVLASLVPAMRAVRLDPVKALRE